MSGGIEAAGELATGAIWARAVEPAAGEAVHDTGRAACLNCGTMLVGHYCHTCGQSGHVRKTLMSIVHDLLHGVFHFEGKIWRTVPMLVLHPGQLTRRYIDGERAKFVSPLALFLFTVFLLFATFSTFGPATLGEDFADGLTSASSQVGHAKAQTDRLLVGAIAERAERIAAHRDTKNVDRRIASLRQDAANMEALTARLGTSHPDDVGVHSSIGWLDQGLKRARDNPGLILYKMQSAAYKFSWVLIFLSTPLVALLFLWRWRFGLYDHATFVTYSLSFMSLLVILLQIASAIGAPGSLLGLAAVFVPPVHMFAQLRGAYGLSVFSALWRTVFLLVIALTALVAFGIGVVMLEVAH